MRKIRMYVAALVVGGLTLSSCIGSFGLWNNLRNWNAGVGNKFANEIVFLAFHIIPVYPVAYLADILVLNSVEFWSGENPVTAQLGIKEVKGKDGHDYLIATREDGYTISRKGEEGKELSLVYEKETQTWNVREGEKLVPLFRSNGNGTYTVHRPNAKPLTVTADEIGKVALRKGFYDAGVQ